MGRRLHDRRHRLAALVLLLASGIAAARPEEPVVAEPSPAEPPTEVAEPAEAAETPPEEAAARKEAARWAIEGYLAEELDYVHASGEASDDDLDSATRLFLDATKTVGKAWHVRFHGLLHVDCVGDSQPDDPLRDFWDDFDHAAQGRLYEAYVDLPKLMDDTLLVRLGRQYVEEEVFLQFDGGRLDLDLGRKVEGLNLSLFAGVPVYFPEASRDGDWLLGLVIRGKLGEKTRARLSYYHVSQFFEGINDPAVDPVAQPFTVPAGRVDDDLLGLSVWHDFADNVRFYGLFSVLDFDPNELQLQLRWFSRDTRWTVTAEFYELFDRLVNVANEISPYVPLLGSYEPFVLATLRATCRPGERWVFQGGLSYRALEDESDEGTFNHEYWRYYAGATRLGVLAEQMDLTVTVNGYTGSSGPDVVAVTTAVDYKFSAKVRGSAGIDYSYYKYIWQQGSERDNVWTYYVNVDWQIRPKVDLDAGFSIDVDDLFTYTQLTLRLTVRF
jgi:hypothetical protein